jgi:hypothetical protein
MLFVHDAGRAGALLVDCMTRAFAAIFPQRPAHRTRGAEDLIGMGG